MAILTRVTFVAALLATAAGCQRSPTLFEPTEGSISVHAVLSAGSDSATVLITRASLVANAPEPGTLPVTDARVRLVHGTDTLALLDTRSCRQTFTNEPATAGCYAAHVPGSIRAGAIYELLVNIPGEAPIHGSTRVPFPPQIVEPGATGTTPVLRMHHPALPPTALTARWSGADGERRMELRFAADRDDCGASIGRPNRDVGYEYIDVTGADTATVTAAAVYCQPPSADSYTARFVVTVYDASYTRYRERDESAQRSRASVGLTGAFGVFGAAASSAVPVVLSVQ